MKQPYDRLELVKTTSDVFAGVDLGTIINKSKAEMTYPLTEEVIAGHEFGVVLVDKRIFTPTAVGYVACKNISEVENCSIEIENKIKQWQANIGGLFLATVYRGQGLGAQMVYNITSEVFRQETEVNNCVALCNRLSAPVFYGVGYEAGEANSEGKIPFTVTRQQW